MAKITAMLYVFFLFFTRPVTLFRKTKHNDFTASVEKIWFQITKHRWRAQNSDPEHNTTPTLNTNTMYRGPPNNANTLWDIRYTELRACKSSGMSTRMRVRTNLDEALKSTKQQKLPRPKCRRELVRKRTKRKAYANARGSHQWGTHASYQLRIGTAILRCLLDTHNNGRAEKHQNRVQ